MWRLRSKLEVNISQEVMSMFLSLAGTRSLGILMADEVGLIGLESYGLHQTNVIMHSPYSTRSLQATVAVAVFYDQVFLRPVTWIRTRSIRQCHVHIPLRIRSCNPGIIRVRYIWHFPINFFQRTTHPEQRHRLMQTGTEYRSLTFQAFSSHG